MPIICGPLEQYRYFELGQTVYSSQIMYGDKEVGLHTFFNLYFMYKSL